MNDLAFLALTNGGYAIIDADLFPEFNKHRWSRQNRTGAIVRNTGRFIPGSYKAHGKGGASRSFLLHREVLHAPKGVQVDHINGFRWDNRRCNLRLANNAENNWNTRKRKSQYCRYTSRYKGVHWNTKDLRWVAMLGRLYGLESPRRYLGSFRTEEEAARRYDEAAREAYGTFARLNFPRAGELSAL